MYHFVTLYQYIPVQHSNGPLHYLSELHHSHMKHFWTYSVSRGRWATPGTEWVWEGSSTRPWCSARRASGGRCTMQGYVWCSTGPCLAPPVGTPSPPTTQGSFLWWQPFLLTRRSKPFPTLLPPTSEQKSKYLRAQKSANSTRRQENQPGCRRSSHEPRSDRRKYRAAIKQLLSEGLSLPSLTGNLNITEYKYKEVHEETIVTRM